MKSFILFSLFAVLITSAFMNCTLYGSISRIPYFGITMSEYAEKQRDIFLLMYIAGGRLLPKNEKITDLSMTLARRTYSRAFINTAQRKEPVSPYSKKTFDLPALVIRTLYWITPVTLALLFLVILIPSSRSSTEED